MQTKAIKIFIIVFLIIISTPLILVLLKVKITPVNVNEKEIGLNFKRNFPLRKDIFKLYAYIKKDFFDTEPIPNAVINGKNDWKFLGNKFSNALSESKSLIIFNNEELSIIKENILTKKNWLENRNIKFYLSIAPNKHSIYDSLIPIKKRKRKTKLEQLDSICKNIGVSFINLGSEFPLNSKLRLYHKTDSHWNHLGGFYAFKSTLKSISKDFKKKKFNLYTLNDFNIITYPSPIGDLNRVLFKEQNEEFIDIKPKYPFSFIEQEKKLTIPSDYRFNKKYYEERYNCEINDLKILVLRDSFFGAYFQLIADNFGKSIFVWRHNFNKELIETEKPNIVYYELVERNLDILLKPNFNHSPN